MIISKNVLDELSDFSGDYPIFDTKTDQFVRQGFISQINIESERPMRQHILTTSSFTEGKSLLYTKFRLILPNIAKKAAFTYP